MKKILVNLILISLISGNSYANTSIDIKSGDKAPFDGLLMDKEKSEIVKNQLIERDQYKSLNESYERSVKLYKENEALYEQKSELLMNYNKRLLEELNKTSQINGIERFGYFMLGVIGTIGGVYAAKKIISN